MALLTHYASFFVSPFGEKSVTDELNAFLQSHRIVNVEKRLIDGDRGTGWVFLVEYAAGEAKSKSNSNQRIDYREVLNTVEYALFDKLQNLRSAFRSADNPWNRFGRYNSDVIGFRLVRLP